MSTRSQRKGGSKGTWLHALFSLVQGTSSSVTKKLKKISQKDQMTDPHVSKLFLLPAVKQLCLDAKLGENYIGFGQDIAL